MTIAGFLGAVSAVLFAASFQAGHADEHPWRLTVTRHSFSASTSCKLRTDKARYQRNVVTFDLGRRRNTTAALYRIDGGQAFRAADDRAEIAKRGFALSGDDLDNPSGGLVRVPAERLQSAGVIQIESKDNDRPAQFRVDGLAAAIEHARTLGCDDGSFR